MDIRFSFVQFNVKIEKDAVITWADLYANGLSDIPGGRHNGTFSS